MVFGGHAGMAPPPSRIRTWWKRENNLMVKRKKFDKGNIIWEKRIYTVFQKK